MAASRTCRPARANRRETRRDAAHRQSAVRAAHLTARRHATSPRPRRDPPFVPPSCLTNASRANAARANRRETRRDAAHRRSGVRTPPIPPAATHRHRAPDATRLLFLRAAARLPHECLMSQCRPSQSTGDAPRWSPPAIWRTRRPPHRPPPRTVTAPPTRPPRPPTPRRDHARFRAHGGAPRAQDEPPPHARPSDRRADTLVHSAAPVAAPRPCTLQPVCRRSAETLGTPLARAL
jgi:hypothetical protein